jgi:nitrogen fixation protein
MSYVPKQVAEDIQRAVEMADGQCSMAETKWGWRVGILNLPDVARFLRAVRSLGHRGTVSYSAGSGWDWEADA